MATQRVNEKVLVDTGMVQIIRRWTGERKTYQRGGKTRRVKPEGGK